METKFTKGEWYKMNAGQMGVPFIIASGNETIFQCYGEEAEHNANLALSAPEMFELLKMIHLSFGGGRVITFSDKDISDIEQLLTKITK